ncbi:DNA repair-scaffolding protein isoform X3 [Pyxicephalus adspersus]|uniref:DNA repair-scaffolding protein isoform X3 n=1 Tax=Pyxicephalus adspersus TaxID=30357 RepID=UPI003B5CDDDE
MPGRLSWRTPLELGNQGKRSADKIYACFPDEASHSAKKTIAEGTIKPSTLSKAWKKCGEGFHKCPGEKKSRPSRKKKKTARNLAQSFLFDEETSSEDCGKDPADIVWSSSDSNLSNDGSEEEDLPNISELSPQSARRLQDTDMSVYSQSCSGVATDVPMISDFQDDNNLECASDKCNVSETAESVVAISDSESSTSDFFASQQCKPELSKALNIVEYLSDEPEDENRSPAEGLDVPVNIQENLHPSGAKTVSDWVKTAQILLQTPEKRLDKSFKTPDDSAKKKKRFLRQKLNFKDEDMSVIINTYYSQKIIGNQSDDLKNKANCLPLPVKWLVPLSVVFQLGNGSPGNQSKQQISDDSTIQSCRCTPDKGLYSSFTANDSLLDLVETQGAAVWKGACICIVQRVYYLPLKENPKSLQQENNKAALHTTSMSLNPNFRLCLLIQDAYGIFSELQVHLTVTAIEDAEKYCQMLEGKSCCFSGLKILQRTTRARAPGLFSLIDSLWPPLAPIKIHGQSQEQGQIPCTLPPPSFCYVLALRYDMGSDSIKPGDTVSDIYLPPVIHSLHEILQVVNLSQRCSFWATVIYVRPEIQSNLPVLKEFWVYVTDATLQVTSETSGIPKIVTVCVLPSCALDTMVLEALNRNIPCKIFFKDAVKENGRIICVERTVLSLQKPLLSHAPGGNELTGPVILDKLDSSTKANSLCIVTGIIIGVNERESFSWPVCNLCGSSKLQPSDSDSVPYMPKYLCRQCNADINSPVIRMQLEVNLHCELTPGRKVRLKLHQNTIPSILSSCSSEDGRYEVSAVLGKQVGPVACYVQHVNSSMDLEEICLLQAGTRESQGGLDFAI